MIALIIALGIPFEDIGYIHRNMPNAFFTADQGPTPIADWQFNGVFHVSGEPMEFAQAAGRMVGIVHAKHGKYLIALGGMAPSEFAEARSQPPTALDTIIARGLSNPHHATREAAQAILIRHKAVSLAERLTHSADLETAIRAAEALEIMELGPLPTFRILPIIGSSPE